MILFCLRGHLVYFAFSLIIFSSFLDKSYGQNKDNSRIINITYVLSNTSLFESPVLIANCIEGCTPLQQKSNLSHSIDVSFSKTVRNNIGFNAGFGFYQFSIQENGKDVTGRIYEDIISHNYINLSSGIGITKEINNHFSHFYEMRIIFEHLLNENEILRTNNFASSLRIGLLYSLYDKVSIDLNMNYKMGLVNYRKVSPNYIPFGFGLGIGVNFFI